MSSLEHVAATLDRRLASGADLVESVFGAGRRTGWARLAVSGVNGILARIAAVEEVFPLVGDEMSSMIYHSEHSAWTIRKLSSQATGRTGYSEGVVVNCGLDPVLLEVVELPPDVVNDQYDENATEVARRLVEILPDALMPVSDWRSIYRLHESSPGRDVLCIDRPFTEDYVWLYDFDAGRCVGFNASSGADTSVGSVIDVVASTGKPEAVELLEMAASHRLHHIRWQAVLRLMDISPERARLVCEPMLEDRHPQVRELAGRLIDAVRARE